MLRLTIWRIPLWAYSLLLLVLLVLSSFIVAHIQAPVDGISARIVDGKYIVSHVVYESPSQKAGIILGDRILSIDHQPVSSRGHKELLEKYRAGEVVSYKVESHGEFYNVEIQLESKWAQNQAFLISYYLLILIVSISSLLIIYKRPYDRTARIFFIYLQLFALAQNFCFIYIDNAVVIFGSVIFFLGFNLFGVVLVHFHLNFPSQVSYYNRIKGLLWAMYLTGIIIGLTAGILLLRKSFFGTESALAMFETIKRWSVSWMSFTLILALTVAVNQFITLKNTYDRKQLRLVLIGSFFGLITPIFYGIYPEFAWSSEYETQIANILDLTNAAGTYIMTSFLAVAIFLYRIWNIEIFIRRTILYSLATIIILLSYFLLLHIVNILLITETKLIHFLILSISIITFLLLKDIIQKFIDRLFYYESYDSTQIVDAFEKNLAGIYNFEKLSSGIAQSLNKTFHAKTFLFALKIRHRMYRIVQMQGLEQKNLQEEFSINNEVASYLSASKIFSMEEVREKPALFRLCNGDLVVPLLNDGKSYGFFVMGPKLSENSYTLQDISLLSLLSKRVVSLFQSASLYEKDLNRQLMLEQERTRIAKDIHDDVGASLTRISIMSDLVNNPDADPASVKKWSREIADTCRAVTQEMTQIIWALSPKSNTFEGLLAYLRRHTIEYLEPAKIKCEFHFPESIEEVQLGPETRRNVYLSIREALNNIIKHSKANKVIIRVIYEKNRFTIKVTDNGIGYDPDKLKWQGNGLISMKKRMEVIRGKTLIHTGPQQGTEISFIIPMAAIP